MKFIFRLVTIAMITMVVPNAIMAEETQKAKTVMKKVLNPWIDCGIGAMIFSNTSWAAASSNIIWDLGSTAVTSDSSSQNTCNSKKAQMAMFIGTTYANLEEETAKGNGKHIHAMLTMMGCDSKNHREIINTVRVEFRKELRSAEFSSKSKLVKAENYYNLVKNNIKNKHSNYCSVI